MQPHIHGDKSCTSWGSGWGCGWSWPLSPGDFSSFFVNWWVLSWELKVGDSWQYLFCLKPRPEHNNKSLKLVTAIGKLDMVSPEGGEEGISLMINRTAIVLQQIILDNFWYYGNGSLLENMSSSMPHRHHTYIWTGLAHTIVWQRTSANFSIAKDAPKPWRGKPTRPFSSLHILSLFRFACLFLLRPLLPSLTTLFPFCYDLRIIVSGRWVSWFFIVSSTYFADEISNYFMQVELDLSLSSPACGLLTW